MPIRTIFTHNFPNQEICRAAIPGSGCSCSTPLHCQIQVDTCTRTDLLWKLWFWVNQLLPSSPKPQLNHSRSHPLSRPVFKSQLLCSQQLSAAPDASTQQWSRSRGALPHISSCIKAVDSQSVNFTETCMVEYSCWQRYYFCLSQWKPVQRNFLSVTQM